MKLIEANNETVTVQFAREELKDLWHALGDALTYLDKEPGTLHELINECEGLDDPDEILGIINEARRAEETVEGLQKSLAYAKRQRPKITKLSDTLSRYLFQKVEAQ